MQAALTHTDASAAIDNNQLPRHAMHKEMLGDRTKWYGQNGTDKMVYGQDGIGQNGTDKMAWTKWYNFIFCVDFNSVEFNIYLVTKSHK